MHVKSCKVQVKYSRIKKVYIEDLQNYFSHCSFKYINKIFHNDLHMLLITNFFHICLTPLRNYFLLSPGERL